MIFTNRSLFYAGARQFIAGLALHEPDLPAVAIVAPVTTVAQLYTASRARQQAFQQTRDGKRDALSGQNGAREAGQLCLENSRNALVPYLGSDWSESWTQAGFIHQSLAIPTTIPRIVDALEAVETYFNRHPTHGRADLSITAAFAKQKRENLEVAVATVARCKREQRTNRNTRKTADEALGAMLATGRKVLAATLPEDDARWLDFRADVPGDLSRPEGVEGLEWQAGLPGHLTLRWKAPVRGESFLVQVKVAAVDEVFRNLTTTRETTTDVALTPGAQVKLRVLARNASGPGVPSEEVPATVPPLAAVA